jgi:tetratricopeptide (TPR) repeat protein
VDAVAWLGRAKEHEQDEAWAEALSAYEQVLALDPNDAPAHVRAGLLCARLDQPAKAEAHYRTALIIDGGRLDARYHLSRLYQKQGRDGEALYELEEFLAQATRPRDVARGKVLLADLAGRSYEKCALCGQISTLTSHFQRTARGTACPYCLAKARPRRSALMWGWLLFVAAVVALLSYSTFPWVSFLLANLALAVIMSYLTLVPHELSHALAARLAGGKVFGLHFGFGPPAWQGRVGALEITIGRYPFGGQTALAFASRSHLRERLFLSVLAGPAVNGLLLILLLPVYDATRTVTGVAPVEALALASVVVLVSNLIPRKIRPSGNEVKTDGLLLLELVTGRLSLDDAHLRYFWSEAVDAIKVRDYERATSACQAGLALYPDSTVLQDARAIVLLETGHHAEAQQLFQAMLAHFEERQEAKEPGIEASERELLRAGLLNNLAYSTILAGRTAEDMHQARDQALRAFRMAPWMPHIRGTWGSALVETGWLQEGIEQLLKAARRHDTRRGKATCLAHAAIAYGRLGDEREAAAILKKALALNPKDSMVKRAQAEQFPRQLHP